MRFRFRHRTFLFWSMRLIILLILLAGFCFGLFVLEYKGLLDNIATKFPQLEFVARLPKILDVFYLPYQIAGSPLPVYEAVFDPADFKKLEEALAKNTAYQLLPENRNSIPIEFVYNNQSYQAKLRVHGDLSGHWKNKKKSWQIIFNDSNLFEGKKEINLILPEDRSYISEQVSNYRAKKMGLLVPESRFVILRLNGREPAVYFETNGWTKEFLERNQRPDQANLYGEYDELVFKDREHELLSNPAYWKKYTQDSQSQIDNFAEIDLLSQIVSQTSNEDFYRQIPAILDMDNFYKWQVHSMLMGSTHQDFIHNIRLYFNISRGKFEFLPWDLRQFDRDKFADLNYNTLVSRILKNPEFLHQRNKVLWDYLKDEKNLEDDLNFYEQTYQQVRTAFLKDQLKTFSDFYFERKIVNERNLLIQQYHNIVNTLKDSQVMAVVKILPQSVQLDITTRGFSDIVLSPQGYIFYYDKNNNQIFDQADIALKDDFQMFTQREIPQGFAFEEEFKLLPTKYTFFLKKNDFNPENFKLKISNAVTGSQIEPVVRYVDEETFKYFKQISYSREEFLKDNPIFKPGLSGEQIVLYAGTYQISKTVIIPRNLSLEIKPGVQLRFAPDVSLFSYSSIKAEGTKQAPIIFTAQDKAQGWGVMAILDTEKSIFKYCLIEYGGQDYVNGTFVSGQLAFHYTEAEIKNCQFKFANGDDGLNVKMARAEVENNYFYKNKFDGFDFDWARGGRIANNYFKENGNDGIDLSGAENLLIWNNRIDKSGDKCISIGEDSKNTTIIANNLLMGCQDGIAVKDNSKVNLINNTIVNNKIGLAVYEKKPIFGGAFPQAINNIIWGNEKSIEIDSKSGLTISYSDIEGGYPGEANLNQEPIFQNKEAGNYLLLDNQANSSLIKGGNLEAINKILKDKLETVTRGIITLPPLFYD